MKDNFLKIFFKNKHIKIYKTFHTKQTTLRHKILIDINTYMFAVWFMNPYYFKDSID
jgi:hypothetical protein